MTRRSSLVIPPVRDAFTAIVDIGVTPLDPAFVLMEDGAKPHRGAPSPSRSQRYAQAEALSARQRS